MPAVQFKYILDVVDRGSSQLLKADRNVRKSLQATEREYQRQARAADQLSRQVTAGAGRQERATRDVGQAARRTTTDIRGLDRATDASRRGADVASVATRRQTSALGDLRSSTVQVRREQEALARAQRDVERQAKQTTAALKRQSQQHTGSASSGGGGGGGGSAAVAGIGGAGMVVGAAAIASVYAAGRAATFAAGEYTEAARTMAATNAVLRSTGRVANVTASDVDRLADSISRAAGVDDELVAQGANMLLTFTQVRNEAGRGNKVFDRTARAAVDMSAAFKAAGKSMEISDASIQLGKALNDPVKGYTRLQRIGVTFSRSQVKQIEAFDKVGNRLGAQKVILREIEKEFGGAARATAQPIDHLRVSIGNLGEALGGLAAPVVNKGITAVTNFLNQVTSGKGKGGQLARTLGQTARDIAGVASGRTEVRGGVAFDDKDGDGLKTARSATTAEKVAQRARDIAKQVAQSAREAGRQLIDAFRPALPFFQNVLLPLLVGIGKGVMMSVVAAFKVLVPVIKGVATVLGWLGQKAKPLKGVFEGIGTVIGFVISGPILKALGAIPKLGIVFKLLAVPIKALGALLRPVFALVGKLGPAFSLAGRVIGKVAGVAGRALRTWVGAHINAAKAVVGAVAPVAGRVGSAIGRVASAIARFTGKIAGTAARVVTAIVKPFVSLGSKIADAVRGKLGEITAFFGRVGKAIVSAVVNAIKSSAGAIAGAIKEAAGGRVEVLGVNINPISRRGGGRTPAFSGGGRVPILAAGGEMLREGGRSYMIGGDPTRDGTLIYAQPGSEVYTAHGQQLLAAGASRQQALQQQLPHFAGGGIVRAAQAARRAGLTGSRLVTAVAIAGPESRYNPRARLVTSKEDSRGFWQINTYAHPWAAKQNLYDPDVNARAMMRVSGRGRNWGPWSAYTSRNYLAYVDRARQAVIRSRGTSVAATSPSGATSGSTVKVPLVAGASQTRAGLLPDAFSTAFDAARSGQPLSAAARLAQLREAAAGIAFTRDVTLPGSRRTSRSSSSSSSSSGGGGAGWQRPVSGPITSRFGPRSSPGGIGSTNHQGIDFGVPIGTAVRAAKPGRVTFAGARGGYGNYVMLSHAGGYGSAYGHLNSISARVGRRVSGGQIIARSGNTGNSTGPHLHFEILKGGARINPASVMRMRGGGVVGGPTVVRQKAQPTTTTRAGTPLQRGVEAAMTWSNGSLAALSAVIEDAGVAALARLRRDLLAKVKKGGMTTKAVTRLQQIISAIEMSIGDRAGRLMAAVDRRNANIETADTYRQLDLRRRGIDGSSVAGLQSEADFLQRTVIRGARMNIGQIKGAIKRAQKAGDKTKAAELQEELRSTQLALDEALVRQVEIRREIIRAQAQEIVDSAQFGQSLAGIYAQRQELQLRAAGIDGESAAGMQARAAAIIGAQLPTMQATIAALQNQAAVAWNTGDMAGWRQAVEAAEQATNDYMSAQLDAADLMREAARKVMQDVIDSAGFTTSVRQSQMSGFELDQRLAGTYDTAAGRRARAEFVTSQIIPALDGERRALQAAADDERARNGESQQWRDLVLALLGKANEIKQAELDVQETIAENTEPLKEFAGATSFEFGGQRFTDLITAGLGT